MLQETKEIKMILWTNRLIRWSFGCLFLSFGLINKDEGRWIALVIGIAFIITGFFRPKRCLEEGCSIDNKLQ